MDADQIEAKYGYPDPSTKPKGDNMNMNAGGVKFDSGKVRMDLLPQDALMAIAQVFTYGAVKYDDWNWAKGMRAGRLLAAFDRHKALYLLGEEKDEESGYPHLWHMGCCIMMLISADIRDALENDRRPISMALLEVLKRQMAEGNDPSQTKKSSWADEKFGAGPIDRHWADDIADTEEAKKVLDEVVDSKYLDTRDGGRFMNFTMDELALMKAIYTKSPIPFAGSKYNAMIDYLKDEGVIDVVDGVYELTTGGIFVVESHIDYEEATKKNYGKDPNAGAGPTSLRDV